MSRIHINLASEPFRRDRPILAGSIAAGVVLAALLAMLISLILAERRQVADTRRAIDSYEAQLKAIGAEQSRLEGVLRRPENAEVLERSLFLNTLLVRKGISWTKIFSDLEGVLPHNVRLIAIRLPQINSQNEVLLDMTVGTQSTEPFIQMMIRLEESPLFGPASLHNWMPPTQSDPLYKYRVSVNYAQRL